MSKVIFDNNYSSKIVFGKQKYGRLTHIKCAGYFLEGKLNKKRAAHEFICDCGKVIIVRGKDVKSGVIQSCGCLALETKSNTGKSNFKGECVSVINSLFAKYRYSAQKRRLCFEIPKEIFTVLINQPCAYCGYIGASICKDKTRNCAVKHNGLDRVDNSIGYKLSNVKTCCKFCNFAKGQGTLIEYQQWLDHIRSI